jgi:hypothetical protein
MPKLHEELLEKLPFSEMLHPRGPLNLAAYLPKGSLPPDLGKWYFPPPLAFLTDIFLGPKMYCAYASGVQGSTRLHMDLSGAYNILLHSSKGESEDAAVWWIFKSSDARRLRDYMRRAIPGIEPDEDPINSQRHFLTEANLDALDGLGILPVIIRQRVGDAVMIPAHCPHQVKRLA